MPLPASLATPQQAEVSSLSHARTLTCVRTQSTPPTPHPFSPPSSLASRQQVRCHAPLCVSLLLSSRLCSLTQTRPIATGTLSPGERASSIARSTQISPRCPSVRRKRSTRRQTTMIFNGTIHYHLIRLIRPRASLLLCFPRMASRATSPPRPRARGDAGGRNPQRS